MVTINILIVNAELEDMKIEQDANLEPLYFKETSFHGYWVDSTSSVVTFYVGAETFTCRYCKKNIDIFNSLL